jgi:hypothetical protein
MSGVFERTDCCEDLIKEAVRADLTNREKQAK